MEELTPRAGNHNREVNSLKSNNSSLVSKMANLNTRSTPKHKKEEKELSTEINEVYHSTPKTRTKSINLIKSTPCGQNH